MLPATASNPNVIIIYADDLGFGDLGCYGATNLPTPHLDRLAKEGLKFHQGYASASTCTPSRYSLMVGSYPWRNPRASILRGDAPQLIQPDDMTLPKVFKNAGYRTGMVGKWHLGLGEGSLDWNREIQGTPNDAGFDESFIMAATNDRAPCVYIDNRKVHNLDPRDPLEVTYDRKNRFPEVPTPKTHPHLCKIKGHSGGIVHGIPRLGYMRGGTQAIWNDETMSDVFLDRAMKFIDSHHNQPFFLYYALHQPHAPRVPGLRFKGKSSMGVRGDVIMELDDCVGHIMNQLEQAGLREQTMIIFSSDNGPALFDAYHDRSRQCAGDHQPAGPLRGGKYSSYDGGTRVPFVVSQPGTIKPGETNAMICHVDFLATFATMLEQPLASHDAPDSLNLLNALCGKDPRGREELIVEGANKNTVFRSNDWTYIPPHEGPAKHFTGIELGNATQPQLYNLSCDISQIENTAEDHPQLVDELSKRLEMLMQSPCTR